MNALTTIPSNDNPPDPIERYVIRNLWNEREWDRPANDDGEFEL